MPTEFVRRPSHINPARRREGALEKKARRVTRAQRSRLESFKRLGATLRTHFDVDVRGMLEQRSNEFVEATNGLMQQAKRAARGFRTASDFIAIAYLRLGRFTYLPASPFVPALPLSAVMTTHRA